MGAVEAGPQDRKQPLARLFAIALRSMVDDLHERLAGRGWDDVRPSFGFVLLAARNQAVTGTDLAVLMGTSKQATSKLINSMTEAGYIEPATTNDDRRARPVRITDKGASLLAEVEEIYTELEEEWAAVIGSAELEVLRADLTAVLTQRHRGQLPSVRPTA
jgi:DNA-binding MarR family transcriptional regulator